MLTAANANLEPASASGRDSERKIDTSRDRIRVALFCGGGGSGSLIRELLRWPQVHLSLLVNAYDDGLSTGELRDLVSDMLGPSDFRKNVARLVNLHSSEQYALQRLLDHRFSKDVGSSDIQAFGLFVANPVAHHILPEPLKSLFGELQPRLRLLIAGYLRLFLEYQLKTGNSFNYANCSLGNLVFAGAYLESNHDFNASIQKITSMCGSRAELINVTRGENRTLVALKADGELLSRESQIVGPQSPVPIRELFLVKHPLDAKTKAEFKDLPFQEKCLKLRGLHSEVQLSPEADYTLRHSDIIVYGPGTQFSSLLPSYRTRGIADAIKGSGATLRIFICNLDADHDIQCLSASDLVDNALSLLGDCENSDKLMTHIFYDTLGLTRSAGVKPGLLSGGSYKSAIVVEDKFENSAIPGTHSGRAVISKVIGLFENRHEKGKLEAVDIYVDLLDRSRALESLMQEFLDIPWDEVFSHVRLQLNLVKAPKVNLPKYASVSSVKYRGPFTEVSALLNWLAHCDTEYLVTLSGDGEYRLGDVLLAVQFLKTGAFGAVHGSRTQSRQQFHSALDSAYGEHRILQYISWCGAFLFTAVFGLLFHVIFSDPFTGFRAYRRSKLTGPFAMELKNRGSAAVSTISRLLIRHRIEIAEIPVTYRTFRGFTKPYWRITRGVKNILGVFQ